MQGRVRLRLLIAAALMLAATHARAAGTRSQAPSPRAEPADTEALGGSRDAVFRSGPPQHEEVPQAASPSKADAAPPTPSGPPSKDAAQILNINFGMAPRDVRPNGAIGGRHDVWTLVDVGETTKTNLPMADGTPTKVSLELSATDGEWGIPGAFDVYHAYLYHNARNVDLALTLRDLPPGRYDVYVFAHGAAPDQNAAIEITSAGKTSSGKSTSKDGSMTFLSREHEEGVQYVHYAINVKTGKPVTITSRRDGSDLAMLNAVQLQKTTAAKQKPRRNGNAKAARGG
jgi:hypothetical protein